MMLERLLEATYTSYYSIVYTVSWWRIMSTGCLQDGFGIMSKHSTCNKTEARCRREFAILTYDHTEPGGIEVIVGRHLVLNTNGDGK